MRSARRNVLALLPRWVWLPVIACAFGWGQQTAVASCGDYVHTTSPDHRVHSDARSQSQLPCDGPACRAHRETPVAPAVPPTLPTVSDVILCGSVDSPAASSKWRMTIVEPLSLPDCGSGVFHPPRSV